MTVIEILDTKIFHILYGAKRVKKEKLKMKLYGHYTYMGKNTFIPITIINRYLVFSQSCSGNFLARLFSKKTLRYCHSPVVVRGIGIVYVSLVMQKL